MDGNRAEIVALGRKIADIFEFGHRFELAVETESASVIATTEESLVACALANSHSAMSADVGDAVKLVVGVPSQQQWLVKKARHELKREDLSGDFGEVNVANELPAIGEVAVF